MRPGPALLLLGLGLGLGLGSDLGRRPPPPAPRKARAAATGAPGSPSGGLLGGAPGPGVRSGGCGHGRARLSLRPRAAREGGGVVLRGGRGLCLSGGPPAGPAPRCLRALVLLRARRARRAAAPARVDLHLSAPRGRLSLRWLARLPRSLGRLEWTFRLGLLGPAAAAARVAPRSVLPRGPLASADFIGQTQCPTDGPTPVVLEAVHPNHSRAVESSVSCQVEDQPLPVCVIHVVKINKDSSVLQLTREMEATISATVRYDCLLFQAIIQKWLIFPLPSVSAVPDWTKPLKTSEVKLQYTTTSVHIPKKSLMWGVYLFNFSVYLKSWDPEAPVAKASDAIHVVILRSPLEAVILGDASVTIKFKDGLTLDGSQSSDPDANSPLEGLQFFWYCTTEPKNYQGEKIIVRSKDVCLPEQADLKWTWASGPVLTLLPETLKGGRVYFFRMVIEKNDRRAFSDRRVHVLPGPKPVAVISCVENCDLDLVISDRFSLSLNCTNCKTSRDVYKWSILSLLGSEIQFDWMGQTTTGRNGAYLSVKAFAFEHFVEDKFWVSLYLNTWSGATLVLRHPFIINHVPEIGECKINPAKGIALITKFVVQCSNFKDRNVPLTYKILISDVHGFGEISSLKENTLGTILYLGKDSTSPPSFLPVGVLANHYALKIYVQVYNSLGPFSQVTLYATVQAPTDMNSSEAVLNQLFNFTMGPDSLLSTLLQNRDFLPAGYLMYVVASVLNSMKTELPLQADKTRLREHLFNQSFVLPVSTLVEISQLVVAVTKLTQKASEFTLVSQKLATERIWQANQALQEYRQKDKHVSSEQIEIVCTGILTSLSNILKLTARHIVVEEPFHVVESLADTVLAGKVPEDETTALRTSNFNMYVKKTEKWNVTKFFSNEKHCRNCFYPTLNEDSVPSLPTNAPISMMFCEFTDDPFPWLNYQDDVLTEVVGFRMTGTEANGEVIEITPDVLEVYLVKKNLSFAVFSLTVGPSGEPDKAESLRKTVGGFSFEADGRATSEVLVHIITDVTVLFTVLVYAGSQITPDALVTTFLVPRNIPPIANQSDLFDPACAVNQARVVCLSRSLLRFIAQRSGSSGYTVTVVLQAPRFVMMPSDKLVRISIFSVQCLDMRGLQSDWREDTCILGERTTWNRIHCVCKNTPRPKQPLAEIKLPNPYLHTRYLTARMIVVPNPVDLRLEVIKTVPQNPVTLFTVLFIMLVYIILAFWALHRDEMDQFLREHVIVLLDNDPYDKICYLVTVFTGSRCGSGTRADVFIQLRGTEGTSEVHCLSHPQFTVLCRGSINTFLLTTQNDLGDIHSIRVWHNNEGRAPSWYLSRIKVESLFSRNIWLFMCRKWLSIDTTLDRTFHATHPDKPLRRKDFFLIDASYSLGRSHLWFSIFSSVVAKPFSRLQRLSCCLAMLLSSLLCNIMFFNLNRQKEPEPQSSKYIRSMIIGLESVLITIPVQVTIISLFVYSQREPQVPLSEVSPQKPPVSSAAGGHWEERLEKWHAREAAKARSGKPKKPPPKRKPGRRKAPARATSKTRQQVKVKRAESKVSDTSRKNENANNPNTEDNQSAHPEKAPPPPDPPALEEKPRVALPWWCIYVAWFLVFATCSVSSFFIVFYGLTYGYEKSIEWLFASFCSFTQSVFLVQPLKIILLSGMRTNKAKYCKNLPWISNHRYTQIRLQSITTDPEEMRRQHEHVSQIRGSRMYQPLTEDEIRIFQRKKRIKRRAFLFLSYILAHFIFLALLLGLVALLRHTDCFYYNRFIHDQFSMDLATVTKLEGIFPWLNSVLLPLLHNNLDPTFLPDSSSKILGLPLMRQVRAVPGEKACLPAKHFAQSSLQGEIRCHPEYGTDPEDTKSYSGSWNRVSKRAVDKNAKGFTYKPPEKRWAYSSYGLLQTYGSGGYVFYFFPEEQQFNSTLRLKELQNSKWLDEKTWAVILELTTYNPDASLFCCVSVIFEVSQLGVVNTSLSAYSFSLADFNPKTSAEIYLYAAILIFFAAYIVDEGYVIMQEGASYVTSVYNLLNFALKCIFTVLIVLFFRKHFLATSIIQFYLANSKDFIPFHAVSQVDHIMRVMLGFLLFLTIMKTLRYSRVFYDVRLAQRAIQAALPGICHMALVVSAYFFVYMALGYLVFGQHEWNYSNMIRAAQTIFSYCVSAFQNTEFSSNRVLGVLFLSSFMLVMICILINLFQAVILSAYEEMKQPVYEEPSEEAEAMTYLCRKLRSMFGFLSLRSKEEDEPEFFINMVYGQPEKSSRRYLGLKTRNINGKKMVYLVV
ncbi:polycystin family receptor for egg jelly [Camelus dromedarius]|uniref:polycystin family receptor for egg jelly n=1 Tax=Camelus dromedarius TaxID=9838 RepID=UPI00311992FB